MFDQTQLLSVVYVCIYFPMPSSFEMSLDKLNCKVLCHGNKVRVTGSFLRRSLKVESGRFRYDASREARYSVSW